ncbi:uncharacterized [Tachysurus ichikawai]
MSSNSTLKRSESPVSRTEAHLNIMKPSSHCFFIGGFIQREPSFPFQISALAEAPHPPFLNMDALLSASDAMPISASERAEAGQLFERPCPNARPEGSWSGHPSLVGSPELSVQIERGGTGLTSGPLTREPSWALWQHWLALEANTTALCHSVLTDGTCLALG